MNPDKKEIKERLRNMRTISEFNEFLDKILISEEEKEIMRLIYKEKKTLTYVADTLGMSESSVKKKHSKILLKIGKYF